MITHFIPQEKFTSSFINFINDNFKSENHIFLVNGQNKTFNKNDIKNSSNVLYVDQFSFEALGVFRKYINKSDKVIVHSLMFRKWIKYYLFLNKKILNKMYWAIWGSDLYHHIYKSDDFISKIDDVVIRKRIIKNFGGIITQIKGDYELAKEWYGAKGKYYSTFMYTSNLYKDYGIKEKNKDSNKLYIQVGNSADSSNNHIEVLQKIYKNYGNDVKVICPLSYGDRVNRDSVIKEGQKLFGNNFKALVDFIPLDEYLSIISQIDVAIFNHKRQQAVGNITTLLGFGKKVYIRKEVTTWNFLKERNINIYDASNNLDDLHIKMTEEEKKHNINRIKECFSKEKLINELEFIFNS